MRKFLIGFVCVFVIASMFLACGQKEESGEDHSAAGQPEEMADSTRMDSAAMMDSTMVPDSAAMHEGMEDAAEEATGH